jgi:hypothetical protein
MPRHRNSERLPEDLLEKVKASPHSEFFGHVHGASSGLSRYLLSRPKLGKNKKAALLAPFDVQYSLKDGILTRTEFLRGKPAIPVHMAHYDPATGKRFSVVFDRFA